MNNYELKPGHKIMTKNNGISYCIRSGKVFVSLLIASFDGTGVTRQIIGVVGSGTVVPGVSDEIEYNGRRIIAHLIIEPEGAARIEDVPYEPKQRDEFLDRIGYEPDDSGSDHSDVFGYLIRKYYLDEEKRNNLIGNNLEHRRQNRKMQEDIIASAFSLKHDHNNDSDDVLYLAMEYLCEKMGVFIAPLSDIRTISDSNVTVEGIARCSGFLCRQIDLDPKFYKKEISPLICFTKDDHRPIVLYQNVFGRKCYFDPVVHESGKLKADIAENIDSNAYCIHRPLNDRKLDVKTLFRFGAKEFSVRDLAISLIAMFLVTRLGIEVSDLHTILYDRIIPQGSVNNLLNFGLIMAGCTMGSMMFSISQNIATFRQDNKIKYSLQAAIYNRVFHMPEKFYRKHESGELAYRAGTAASSYYTLYHTITTMVLHLMFAIIYFNKMNSFSSRLASAGSLFAIINVVSAVLINQLFLKYRRDQSRIMGKIKSYLYQVFSGIDTIRAVGAEDTALYQYMDQSAAWSVTNFKYGVSNRMTEAVSVGITCISTVIIYKDMVDGISGLTPGMFFGFTMIYGSYTAAMNAVGSGVAMVYSMIPMMKNSMEILKSATEQSDGGEVLGSLEGDIVLNHVQFSYEPGKPIIRDISLHITPGEYVAIVGTSGCGKSTLLKLLLGFEEPKGGQIRYDDKPLPWLNKPELRRFFGVVLQEDGLFMGSIYKNIVMSNGNYSEEDVVNVLTEVGLLEDIKAMPLGLFTPVSEDAHTISGGQIQRILLARALIKNPRVLFLDEATSSLDNISQKIVTDAVSKRKITRVVIAHRLSTIMQCDRIIVLDQGRIVEEGTYEQLTGKNGLFRQLVENQMLYGG